MRLNDSQLYILAAWESLTPHSKSSSLYNTEDLKAKIRFSNKWFKNILRPLLRNWQWENYTDISANTIINFTTQAATNQEMPGKECVEYNYWALCWACVSSYANIPALGQWSFIRLVSTQGSPGQSLQSGPTDTFVNVRIQTLSLSISLKHSHTSTQLPTKSDWNSQYTMCGSLNAMKYSFLAP